MKAGANRNTSQGQDFEERNTYCCQSHGNNLRMKFINRIIYLTNADERNCLWRQTKANVSRRKISVN